MTIEEAKQFKLSQHFTLWEFLKSEKAVEHGLIQDQLDISEDYISNLKMLCENVLLPLRKELGVPIIIRSGFRCNKLNKKVGGANTSDHLSGKAADIYIPGKMQLVFFFIKNRCKFKQLINEHNLTWIHIAYDKFNNKMEVFDL